jgi:anhydro-N-acetylmuramic acid kinase
LQRLKALWEKTDRLVIGLMSGTSADGIDAVLVCIHGCGTATKVRQIAFTCTPFSPDVRKRILHVAAGEPATAEEWCSLKTLLGSLYADCCETLCEKAGVPLSMIDLVGNHGQTIWHIPRETIYLDRPLRGTLQIGEDAVIAERLGCPVVGDFRVRDMAAGGQGAPLVPYTEYLLYRDEEKHVALQNIGGIGNVTILPAGGRLCDVTAFDTGPGNMIIDALTEKMTGGKMTYDEGGLLAAGGTVSDKLLAHMMDDPYLSLTPPKTTGREKYGPAYVKELLQMAEALHLPPADTLATATRFTAETIACGIRRFAPVMPDRMIVGGGGSKNRTLLRSLDRLLPDCEILTNEDLGLDSDAKEAIAFAVLANEAVFGICNNAPGATGAARPVVMGKLSL